MTNPTHERVLRKITIWAMLPAFPMLLSAGIKADAVAAACGIIPLFCSFVMGFVYLRWTPKADTKRSWIWGFCDIIISVMYLCDLLPIWIIEPLRLWRGGGDFMMLETYGSSFLILNMAVHFYLFLANLNINIHGWSMSRECPRCAAREQSESPGMATNPSYSLLGEEYRDEAEDATPRPSEEV
ncbi:hypothetical protein K469DRAFT_716635 [Zopfia rhizophila CBS 207.26]|uniref:MARVEL domain-containing protein n=1 Tax=Zopfia rhizophila CBS 207.26 TaxID=1314779 RepID=A0A6A6ELF9_9PEZI|nr:hypothetical protein K469DRAFT_716635 [Zopfia rhizophila CBS 207.26]